MAELMNLKGLVHYLGVHKTTFVKWRQAGYEPPALKIGRRVYYSREQISAWLTSLQIPASVAKIPVRVERQSTD